MTAVEPRARPTGNEPATEGGAPGGAGAAPVGQATCEALAEALSPLVAEARDSSLAGGRPVIASVTVPADGLDPIALFETARALGLAPALWLQPATGLALVAMGAAWTVTPTGADRFSVARTAWETLAAGACVADASGTTRGTGPLLLGGFAFEERGGVDETWAGFGPGSLVLPRLLWTHADGATWLTANAVLGGHAPRTAADPLAADPATADQTAGALADLWSRVVATASADGIPHEGVPTLRIVDQVPVAGDWRTIVGRFAGAVGRGRVDKVVLARRVDLLADHLLDVGETLRRLVVSAPESTVFALVAGDAAFLGATPERLVRTEGRDARTVAIAGSVRRGADEAEDEVLAADLLASEKEREEHAVVVRMLRECLRPLCDDLDIAPRPRVIRLGTVQHLCTDVTARLSDRAHILALAGVLHPTPAVGGQPRDVALELIRDQEGFDRGWYAAPLGWVDRDGDGDLVVALRCGVVRGDRASLFAGCGIVADSDPDREWEESRMKLRVLGSALGRVEL